MLLHFITRLGFSRDLQLFSIIQGVPYLAANHFLTPEQEESRLFFLGLRRREDQMTRQNISSGAPWSVVVLRAKNRQCTTVVGTTARTGWKDRRRGDLGANGQTIKNMGGARQSRREPQDVCGPNLCANIAEWKRLPHTERFSGDPAGRHGGSDN